MEAEMSEIVKSKDKPSKAELNEELDDALKGTFPASDPVGVGATTSGDPTGLSIVSRR
jgi:hypothetical protein